MAEKNAVAKTQTVRTDFAEDTWTLIFNKQNELQKQKLRKVTPGQAIEVLLKDAYLREKKVGEQTV